MRALSLLIIIDGGSASETHRRIQKNFAGVTQNATIPRRVRQRFAGCFSISKDTYAKH